MIPIRNKQKKALEKITGKYWYKWHPKAIEAYFSFTDNGEKVAVIPEAKNDFDELMSQHRWHSVVVELWKKDFRAGLLFLEDFTLPQIDYGKWVEQGFPEELPKFMYPDAHIKHAFEIYQEVMGYIPSKYRNKVTIP